LHSPNPKDRNERATDTTDTAIGRVTDTGHPTGAVPPAGTASSGAADNLNHPRVRLTTQLREARAEVRQTQTQLREARTELRQARAEATRYRLAAAALRRTYADLTAACWAALGAADEGDPYAFTYLTDELRRPPAGHPLHDRWDRDPWEDDREDDRWGWGL
jgi:hypothetical protein